MSATSSISPAGPAISGVGANSTLAAASVNAFVGLSEQECDRMRYLLEQLCAMAVRSAPRAIRRHRVLELTGIGKSHMYNLLDEKSPAFDPTFPRPFRLGTSTNAPAVWWEHQVVAWLQCKAAAAERERCISSKKLVRRVSGVSQLRSEELQ